MVSVSSTTPPFVNALPSEPSLVRVADSASPLVGYRSAVAPTLPVGNANGFAPPSPALIPVTGNPVVYSNQPRPPAMAPNGPVMVQVPDYVWQQLLLPALKASPSSLSQPPQAPVQPQHPFITEERPVVSPEPKATTTGMNTPLNGKRHPSKAKPASSVPEEPIVSAEKPSRGTLAGLDNNSIGDEGDEPSTRELVRRFETQAVHYLNKHPEARQKLEDAQDRLTDLVANPEDALEGARLELQLHPLIKSGVWLSQPLIRHEIKQLPDKASERAPFLNRTTALTIFNFITESDKAHEKREGPVVLDI